MSSRRRTRRRRRKKRTGKRRKMRGGEEYTIDTLYDFLSNNSEETQEALSIDVGPILAILEDFRKTSEKKYMKGSYYIMNIERKRADVINAAVVEDALQKGFTVGATNSFEHQSMMKTLEETKLLKTFFTKDLPLIKGHYEFKPGAPGAVAAEVSFNTAKEEKALVASKAKEEKPLAIAKAKEEKALVASKAKEEKALVASKAKEEKALATAKAKEEKALATAKDQQSGGRGKRTRKRRKSRRKSKGRKRRRKNLKKRTKRRR